MQLSVLLLLFGSTSAWQQPAPYFLRPPSLYTRTAVERCLFGGGDKKGGEGKKTGGGGMGDMMNQFKQVQEIAKRTKQMQADLEAARCVGKDADGKVEITLQGNTKPLSVRIDPGFFDTSDGEAVAGAIVEALGVANAEAKTKMTEAVAEMYKGLPGMPPGGMPPGGIPGM